MALYPISLQVQRCWFRYERSVALGFILNELVTNSLKYAFPEHRRGTIAIEFLREGDDYKLLVRDDGNDLEEVASSCGFACPCAFEAILSKQKRGGSPKRRQ